TEKLSHNSDFGFGYFAGFPWFTQFWGRDSGWIIPAVIDYGDFESAKNALITLAKFNSDGCIPNIIYMNGKAEYNSADATPLWIIALNHYVKNSGDLEFLHDMESVLIKAVDWCRQNDKDRDGFVEADSKETWMDTLDRSGKPIEIQAFLIEALKSAGNMLHMLKDSGREKMVREQAIEMGKKFEKAFWDEKGQFYLDRIDGDGDTKTINSVFPLVFETSQRSKQVLDKIESDEFSSAFGIRTVSKNSLVYNPMGYHTGSIWGWITALAACAEFKNGRPEKGIYYLGILSDSLSKSCIGAIGEAWNAENGSPLLTKENLREEGACLQGWSSAMVVRCVDEYMLGIGIDALNNTITVSPSLLDGMKVFRRKRIGDDYVDLTFERSRNKLKVNYQSSSGKEYRIIAVPKI
ncbi:MAG TPA: amylo-alpha-1,6-glucosidase, partial [archaeon]|nr:amylo-alpha-1,6-glucosidase [archaeon]